MAIYYDIAAISTDLSGDPAQFFVTSTLSSTNATTRGQILIAAAAAVLGSAGWTTITSNTATFIARGLQAPWFDITDVPSWYTENIPWVSFVGAANTIAVKYGMWNGAAGTHTNATTMSGSHGGSGTIWYLVANPYQFAFAGTNDNGFLMSALHVPDFVQERAQVKNCMVGLVASNAFNTTFNLDNGVSWTLYQSNIDGVVQTWSDDPNQGIVMVCQIGGGVRSAIPSGQYIWTPSDANMLDPTDWHPTIMPPTVAFVPGTGTGPPTTTNVPFGMGMLWDALLINRDYPQFSTFTGLPEVPIGERRNWLTYGSASGEFPNSLMFIIGLT